jgi:hypothetical protein
MAALLLSCTLPGQPKVYTLSKSQVLLPKPFESPAMYTYRNCIIKHPVDLSLHHKQQQQQGCRVACRPQGF